MPDAVAAIIIFVAVALAAIVIVRQFDKALRLARATPKGPTPNDRAIERVRQEVADLRGRTLREDVAELEQRFSERTGEGER